MGKKLFILIVILFAMFAGIFIGIKVVDNKNLNNKVDISKSNGNTNSLDEYVTDDCINEWADYAEYIEELKETSSEYGDEKTKYLIKNEDNYIKVYKINDDGEELLYKTTNIYVQYLTDEDLEMLNKGIEIVGKENLNKLIEDFE